MAQQTIRTTHRQEGGSPTRTTRIGNAIWKKAQKRAKHEGVSMSSVMHTLVEGYSEGKIDLPRVELTYDKDRSAS